jgi:peptidoglycan/LPS O-acetylase OafA/YrhL
MAASTIHTVAGETTAEFRQTAQLQPLNRVLELDGIRGIAVLLVLVSHFGRPACPPGILNNILGFGWVGVDLFFALSGLLITGILLDSKGQPDYFRRFYVRRVFRILPIYYAYLILFFHVFPLLAHASGRLDTFLYGRGDEAWYWIYLSNWRDAALQNGHLRHFWSLSIEEQFYIVWPLVVYLVSPRILKYVCIGFAICSTALRLAAAHAGVPAYFLYQTTPFRLEGLALGALLALAVRDAILHKRVATVIRWTWPVAAVVLVSIAIRSGPNFLDPLMATYGYAGVAVLCWALVFWGTLQAGTERIFARFLRTSWLVQFGKYSYGLYVWHMLFGGFVRAGEEFARRQWGLSWSLLPVALVVGIGVSYGVALLSWRLIEEPCARLKERVAG